MEHVSPPRVDHRKATALDYVLGSAVVGIGLLSALMSLVMRAHGI